MLIMIETALARLENNLPINFVSTLTELRNQRASMVQTADQFKFCYETLIALIKKQIQSENRIV